MEAGLVDIEAATVPSATRRAGVATPSLARSSMIIATANVVLTVINAGSGVAAARLLGPGGRGELAAAQAVGGLVAMFATLGIGEGLVYAVARRHDSASRSLPAAAIFIYFGCAIVVPFGWFVIPLLGLDGPSQSAARAYSLVAFVFLLGLPGLVLRGLGNARGWTVFRLIGPIAWLGAIMLGPLLGHSSLRIVVTFLTLQVPVLVAYWAFMFRKGKIRRPSVRRDGVPMVRFGFPLLLSSLPALLSLRLDQLVLATQVSTTQLGIYAAAAAWSTLAVPLASAVGNALFPALAAAREPEQQSFLAPVMRRTILLSVVLCAGSAVLAPIGLRLIFGSPFASAGRVAVVLCAGALFLCISAVAGEALRGLNRTRSVLTGEITGCILGIGALALLLPRWNLIGAAWASCIGYSATAFVLLRALAAHQGQPVAYFFVPTSSDAQAIVAGARQFAARKLKRS